MNLVVDVANVMGSTPDGWWKDRLGATSRLLARLESLPSTVQLPDAAPQEVRRILAVVEGQARAATSGGVRVEVRVAPGHGDDTVVGIAQELASDVVVVTADRGLRARLPPGTRVAGPRWLLDLLLA